jgi:hypothetical protein
MARSMLRQRCFLLLTTLLVGAPRPVAAQTPTLQFSGSSNGWSISGYFFYTESKTCVPPNSGNFSFSGDKVDQYGLHYVITSPGSSTTVTEVGTALKTFVLNTMFNPTTKETLQVQATFGPVSVQILVPTNTPLVAANLPSCSVFTNPTPTTNGMFSQTVGPTVTTFPITVTSCSNVSPAVVSPTPSPQCPQPPSNVVYQYAAPATCPVYVYQPRPACCLSRLFCGGSLRLGCR